MFFDGASGSDQDDYVNAASDSTIDDIFDGGGTTSFWINPGSTGEANANILYKRGSNTGWTIYNQTCDSNNIDLVMTVNTAGTDGQWRADCAISLNQWNHVVITYDDDLASNDPIFYVNGILISMDLDNNSDGYQSEASETLYVGNNHLR